MRARLQAVKASPPAASIDEFRQRIEALTAPFAALPEGVKATPGEVGGIPGEWTQAPDARGDLAILYLHGGTYVGGSSRSHRGLASRLAEACRAPAFTLDYRRPPEHPFPAAVEDAIHAFEALAARLGAGNVLVAGDSAGSALATAIALHQRDLGRDGPAGLVLLSPWSDLAFTGPSFTAREDADPWMSGVRLRRSASLYLGDADPQDARASPLYADLRGLPPVLVLVGSDEILYDDAVGLAHKAQEAGVAADLVVGEGLWHVWPLFAAGLPEGRQAIAQVASWTRRLPGWA